MALTQWVRGKRPLRTFVRGVARHWGDAMTGRQSAPLVVLGAIAFIAGFFDIAHLTDPLKNFIIYGQFTIVAIALFYSFYWVWRDEYDEKAALQDTIAPRIDIYVNP